MSLADFTRILESCSAYDDICLTIGVFGEPLAHPDLPAMVQAAKNAGIFSVNIETDGRLLEGDRADALLAAGVDVISVHLDADTPELYRQLKGADEFSRVVRNIEAFQSKIGNLKSKIVLVPHLSKTRATMPEMESFYDRWLRVCGAAVITGWNDYAGSVEDLSVRNMAPPSRLPCRRLARTLTILADGTALACGQDFRGVHPLGNALATPLPELWRSPEMQILRAAHQNNDFSHPLCARCQEWAR